MRHSTIDIADLRSNALVRAPKPARGTTGAAATPIRYVKLAQIVDNQLRCIPLTFVAAVPAQVLSGNNLRTFGFESTVVAIPSSGNAFCDGQPPVPPPVPGQVLEILEGPDAGSYQIEAITSCNRLTVSPAPSSGSDGFNLDWRIQVAPAIPEAGWPADYSQVFKAVAVAGSPLHRYRPYLGPGDHTGSDLVTNDGSEEGDEVTHVSSASANFLDTANPVEPGMYLEIAGGPDAGRHQIASVIPPQIKGDPATQLELLTPMTASATGLSYRIDIVSEHATTLQLVPVGGQLVAVPDQDSVEVKIRLPIRDEDDANTLDTQRELGTTEALDLFNEHGAFLACYRLQVGASHDQGLPIDDRVIIVALPWRMHSVPSALFFDFQNPAQPKYDLSDDGEPVWPIRWLREHYRLEAAIGYVVDHEPSAADLCE